MQSALFRIYETFEDAFGKEKARACVEDLVSLIEIKSESLATKDDLKETELRLTLSIEQVRSDLTKEIEQVRSDLTKEIEQGKTDTAISIERLRVEISKSKIWFITSVGIMLAFLKFLDYILK